MQAVPSLVGSGTVVAAAAAGLVFGQPAEPSPPRPTSSKRKSISDLDNPHGIPASSRPGTASAAPAMPPSEDTMPTTSSPQALHPLASTSANTPRLSRSAAAQMTPPKGSARRRSFIRQGDWASSPVPEVSRDSISSNGSWMRRLSIRPLSQHGSPRSSICPDSPSLTFSYASAAPILSPSAAPPPPRNKLVKRTTPGQEVNVGTLSRYGSRSQMPTLRRPATSHQRSATLQQFQPPETPDGPAALPKQSLDQQLRPAAMRFPADPAELTQDPSPAWSSFFHARIIKSTSRGGQTRSAEGSPTNYPLPSRRIHLRQGSLHHVYLINPTMMASRATASDKVDGTEGPTEAGQVDNSDESPDDTPSRRARRSISMHFSSPSNWIPRSGSIRRPKRGSESKTLGKRHASAPVGAAQDGAQGNLRKAVEDIFKPPERTREAGQPAASDPGAHHRQRNSSSPLPPLSRLSSFNVDLNRLGMPSSSGAKTNQAMASQQYTFPLHSRDVSNERASTLTGSDLEMRGFVSGDDDDTDFKSDTMFDSLRTAGSARLRTVETPLESMFDESPPSTAGNSKTKRLSIQEILGRSWDGDTRIMEEDEGVPTPIRGAQSSHGNADFGTHRREMGEATHLERPSGEFSLANRDFGRLSLDDEDQEDWTRMDENGLTNHLSPPSGSVNSRGVSPNLRIALTSISGNGSPESFHNDMSDDRPRSNIFDWTEPPQHDKVDMGGPSPRPKTVHGRRELDLRGGRSASRKGPAVAHVRSQSVPVVAEVPENGKPASKFGTWASGPKNASEDWEDDFDFGTSSGAAAQGKDSTASFSMVVPASIQATQPTVKAHSGQIRELSLLVNGLKRLCRHGRELDILDESPSLWKEAENVISLASPDEEAEEDGDEDRRSGDFDPAAVDERFLDEGFDAGTLHSVEDPFEASESEAMPKTAVVRERQVVRSRSVFSPDDDIFGGNWPLTGEKAKSDRPQTPDRSRAVDTPDSAMIVSIMEAMQQQRSSSAPIKGSPIKPSKSELFFNTNTLQELVKRANSLFHSLSELVRRAELITQSPACTPRHERHRRHDGSPAFTRVFTDPSSSPPKRLPKSQSSSSALGRSSIEPPAPSSMGQQMQLMTVN